MAPIDNINRPPTSPPSQPTSGPDDLEELVGSLDDEPNQPDPLSQMGYQVESAADRQHEIDEDDEKQKYFQEQHRQKVISEANQVEAGRRKASEYVPTTQTAQKPGTKDSITERGVEKVKEEAREKAFKKIGANIKAKASQVIVKGILTNPYVLAALGIILLIFIIIMVIFSLNAGGGNSGAGPASYPSTDAQREQATLLSALSGNKIANDQTVKSVIDDEKERYARIKANAQKYSPGQVGSIDQKIAELNPLLDSLLATKNKEERIKIRDDIQEKMLAFEGTLPFGDWIAKLAISEVGKDVGEFCRVTGAGRGVGCASFTSIILYDAGVPNAIVPTTMAVWNSQALRTVVERPAKRSAQLWEQQKSSLKPGDVIWWGDGTCSSVRYNGKLFDHVGFYVGNGEAVDTSSSSETVKKRPAAKRDSNCRYFNGAKRYGSN